MKLCWAIALLTTACAGTGAGGKGAAAGPWGASDVDRLVQPFIAQCVAAGGWIDSFQKGKGRTPLVNVTLVNDKTGEARDTHAISAAIENAVMGDKRLQLGSA